MKNHMKWNSELHFPEEQASKIFKNIPRNSDSMNFWVGFLRIRITTGDLKIPIEPRVV